jgi:hypothetical protein
MGCSRFVQRKSQWQGELGCGVDNSFAMMEIVQKGYIAQKATCLGKLADDYISNPQDVL